MPFARPAVRSVLLLAALASCDAGVKGASDYNAGLDAFKLRDHGRARERFEQAVAANPDFSEAHLYLSTARTRLSRQAALAGRTTEAAALWRQSVADRRRAKELMDAGKFFVSQGAEQESAKREVERSLASVDRLLKLSPTDEQIAEAALLLPED